MTLTGDKLENKLRVYAIISPLGISHPYITPPGLKINGNTYTENCLAKKLVPYIRNLPENTQYLFWTDLAHYTNKVVQFLKIFLSPKKDYV